VVPAGPFKLNGVPLRRLNQAYVIATSTKVDVSGVSLGGDVGTDAFYTLSKSAKAARKSAWGSKQATDFFDEDGSAKIDSAEVSAEKKAAQKAVDDKVLAAPQLKDKVFRAYLSSRFTLTRGQKPHAMAF
jgi:large subunit ribosomal protein L6e